MLQISVWLKKCPLFWRVIKRSDYQVLIISIYQTSDLMFVRFKWYTETKHCWLKKKTIWFITYSINLYLFFIFLMWQVSFWRVAVKWGSLNWCCHLIVFSVFVFFFICLFWFLHVLMPTLLRTRLMLTDDVWMVGGRSSHHVCWGAARHREGLAGPRRVQAHTHAHIYRRKTRIFLLFL